MHFIILRSFVKIVKRFIKIFKIIFFSCFLAYKLLKYLGKIFMRIDKYLNVSRILKRRTLAKQAASFGRIAVNGRQVKPSYQVKIGDVVEVHFNSGTLKFKILDIRQTVKKEQAESLYEILGE